MKTYKHPVRQEFELEKAKPKIEFRYVVEFKSYSPNPKSYEVDKPLECLNHDDLENMAKIDAEDAIDKIDFFDPDNIYVEIIIDGTVFRRVKA